MLEIIIVILVILWLVGFFGPARFSGIPKGNFVHILIAIAVILIIVRLLQ